MAISDERALQLVKRIINYRQPQICKHAIACDVLSEMEWSGFPVSDKYKELVKAVVDCEDETALTLIDEMTEKLV